MLLIVLYAAYQMTYVDIGKEQHMLMQKTK